MKNYLVVFFIFVSYFGFSQADSEPLRSINYKTAERLEIKSGSLKNDIHLTAKPLVRQALTDYILAIDTASSIYLTDIDYYNIEHVYRDNNDLVPDQFFEESADPIWKTLYRTPAYLFDIHSEDVHLQINPIFYGNISYDKDVDSNYGYINTRGASMRLSLDNVVTFWSSITENQVRFPNFIDQRVDSMNAIPTKGFFQDFKGTGYDYFEPKGGVAIGITEHINLQFGYDKQFIGDGYRSLFLSENSNNSLFFDFTAKFWKINYSNVIQELLQDGRDGPDGIKPKKYMASHHLSFDATDWLNLGLFESVVFARENQFEFHYLNPIIFYRAIEQQIGSPDNATVGFNYSALIKKQVKLYGQVLIDEFRIDDVRGGDKSWANKFAFQQGIKYIDAFHVDQLDLQAEVNRARPYTYMHNNIFTNYTHYGQALAHPLASNFTEYVAILDYQPLEKLRLNGIFTYADYGTDPDERSWGNDIFDKDYTNRPFDNGVETGQGIGNKTLNIQGRLSYELKHNLSFDVQGVFKNHKTDFQDTESESYLGGSIRWNFGAYDYNF